MHLILGGSAMEYLALALIGIVVMTAVGGVALYLLARRRAKEKAAARRAEMLLVTTNLSRAIGLSRLPEELPKTHIQAMTWVQEAYHDVWAVSVAGGPVGPCGQLLAFLDEAIRLDQFPPKVDSEMSSTCQPKDNFAWLAQATGEISKWILENGIPERARAASTIITYEV